MTGNYRQFERRLRQRLLPTADSTPEDWENHRQRRKARLVLLVETAFRTSGTIGFTAFLMLFGLLPVLWTLFDISEEAILGLHAWQLTTFAVLLHLFVDSRFWRYSESPPHALMPVDDNDHWRASLRLAWLAGMGVVPVTAVVYFKTALCQNPRVDPLVPLFWAILQAGATLLTCFLLIGRRGCLLRSIDTLIALLFLLLSPISLAVAAAPLIVVRPNAPLMTALAWTSECIHLVNYLTPCGWVNQAFLAVEFQGSREGWLWLVPVGTLALLQISRLSAPLGPVEIVLEPGGKPLILREGDLPTRRRSATLGRPPSELARDTANPSPVPIWKSDANLEAVVRSSLLAPTVALEGRDPIARLMCRWLTPRERLLLECQRNTPPRWGRWLLLSFVCPFVLFGLMEMVPRVQNPVEIAKEVIGALVLGAVCLAVALICSPLRSQGRTELSLPWIRVPTARRDTREWRFCHHLPIQASELIPLLFKTLAIQLILVSPLPLGMAWWISSQRGFLFGWVLEFTLRLAWISLNFACLAMIISLPSGHPTNSRHLVQLILRLLLKQFILLGFFGLFSFWWLFLDAWWQKLVGFLGLPLCVLAEWVWWTRRLYARSFDWPL